MGGDDILREIVKNRREIKSCIEASETRILLKFEELKTKINKLEKENEIINNKIENLERVTKKNNLLIFGLEKNNRELSTELVIQELNMCLDMDLTKTDFNNVYALGKSNNNPIKIEFVSYLRKQQLLKNCYKLKDTGISIVHDQTIKQRQEYKILRRHLILAKQDGNKNCYIKNNKLHVNEQAYTPNQLEETEELEDHDVFKSNSAPHTPSTNPEEKKRLEQPQHSKKPDDSPTQLDKMKLRSNSITK